MKIKKKCIAIIIFLLIPRLVCAATYYVDATNGNDTNSGLSESLAWKTIAKVNKAAFQPGDQILLKNGEVWREGLSISSSGSAETPIIISNYGIAALSKPLILCSTTNDVLYWTEISSHIWATPINSYPGSQVRTIFYNTNNLPLSATKCFSIRELNKNWDFYQDTVNNRLLLYCNSNPFTAANGLEIPDNSYDTDNGSIGFVDVSNIRISNISAKYGNQFLLFIFRSNNIIVDNCDFRFTGGRITQAEQGGACVNIQNSHDISISKCILSDAYDDGIAVEAVRTKDQAYNLNFFDNDISKCGESGILLLVWDAAKNGSTIHNIIAKRNNIYQMGKGIFKTNLNTPYSIGMSAKGFNNYNSVYDITYSENIIENGTGVGIQIIGTSKSNITRNIITNNGKYGLNVEENTIVNFEYNLIHSNRSNGIFLAGNVSGNVLIFNNTLVNNGIDDGSFNIQLAKGANNITIKNNLSVFTYPTGSHRRSIVVLGNIMNNLIDYNIYYHSEGPSIYKYAFRYINNEYPSSQLDKWQKDTGQDAHSCFINPVFCDASHLDFNLKPDSPAIDSGTNMGVKIDLQGTAVPQGKGTDVGAFEFIKKISPPKNYRISVD